jgi:hypothetical protein
LYERFLALRYDSPDECRDAAQPAFERLAASQVDLGVMRGLLMPGMTVGNSVHYLQDDNLSPVSQFPLQEMVLLHCLRNQPRPPFLRAVAGFLHDGCLP